MTALPPTIDDTAIWDAWLSQFRLPILNANLDESEQLRRVAQDAERELAEVKAKIFERNARRIFRLPA